MKFYDMVLASAIASTALVGIALLFFLLFYICVRFLK